MHALSQLRAATWTIHQLMEKRIDVKARFTSRDRYRSHLAKMWGFCSMIESRIDPASVRAVLPDYESRRKLDSLTRDLITLGSPLTDIERLPLCRTVPQCGDLAAALGCLYVLEGASLGGRILLPLVERHLELNGQHGAMFLASYGSKVDDMWHRFGVALETWCSNDLRLDSATAAAVATFESLNDWLCNDVAPLAS